MTALSKGIGWWYNWSPSPDGTLSKGFTSGVEFVPDDLGRHLRHDDPRDAGAGGREVPAHLQRAELRLAGEPHAEPGRGPLAADPGLRQRAGNEDRLARRQLLRLALQRHRSLRLAVEVLRRLHRLPGRLRRDALVRVHQVRPHEHGGEVRAAVRQAALGDRVLVPRHVERRHRRLRALVHEATPSRRSRPTRWSSGTRGSPGEAPAARRSACWAPTEGC